MKNCKNTARQQRGTTRETRLKPQQNGLRGRHEHLASELVEDVVEKLFRQAKLARLGLLDGPDFRPNCLQEGGRAA